MSPSSEPAPLEVVDLLQAPLSALAALLLRFPFFRLQALSAGFQFWFEESAKECSISTSHGEAIDR
jgi:hypothetical protein